MSSPTSQLCELPEGPGLVVSYVLLGRRCRPKKLHHVLRFHYSPEMIQGRPGQCPARLVEAYLEGAVALPVCI